MNGDQDAKFSHFPLPHILIRFMRPSAASLWPGRFLGGAAPWRGTRVAGRYPHPSALIYALHLCHDFDPLVQAG